MKLRQEKKIFYREYVSVPYYKNVKASNADNKSSRVPEIEQSTSFD